jgi:hypothetical protein
MVVIIADLLLATMSPMFVISSVSYTKTTCILGNMSPLTTLFAQPRVVSSPLMIRLKTIINSTSWGGTPWLWYKHISGCALKECGLLCKANIVIVLYVDGARIGALTYQGSLMKFWNEFKNWCRDGNPYVLFNERESQGSHSTLCSMTDATCIPALSAWFNTTHMIRTCFLHTTCICINVPSQSTQLITSKQLINFKSVYILCECYVSSNTHICYMIDLT